MNVIFCALLSCQKPFSPASKLHRFCCKSCRAASKHAPLGSACCKFSGCHNSFLPKNRRQQFCSKSCRAASQCVSLSTTTCRFLGCDKTFLPKNRRQQFCTARCRAAAAYLPTKAEVQARKNTRFASRNWHRTLSFDGRYGGGDRQGFEISPAILTEQQRISLAKTKRSVASC